MKYLILTLVFLALGACSSKETDFNKSGGTAKSSSKSGQEESGTEQTSAETANRGTASSETESGAATIPDKVINVGGDYSGDYVSNARGNRKFPDVEGTERFEAVCTNKTNSVDVRKVSVIDTKEGHCASVYWKFGKKYIEAYAKYDMDACTVVYIGIVNNLRNSGYFECQGDLPEDISSDDDGEPATTTEGSGDDGTGDTGDTEPGGDASGGEDDLPTPQFPSLSDFLEFEQKAVRMSLNCKRENDEVFISIVDTVEGPCGVLHKEGDQEPTLKGYAREDMSKCDKDFNTLTGQLVGEGFGCNGSGSSSTTDDEPEAPGTTGRVEEEER